MPLTQQLCQHPSRRPQPGLRGREASLQFILAPTRTLFLLCKMGTARLCGYRGKPRGLPKAHLHLSIDLLLPPFPDLSRSLQGVPGGRLRPLEPCVPGQPPRSGSARVALGAGPGAGHSTHIKPYPKPASPTLGKTTDPQDAEPSRLLCSPLSTLGSLW